MIAADRRPLDPLGAVLGVLLGSMAFAVWMFAGAALHPVLIEGGESDQYLLRAELLGRGQIPASAFHPLMYPLLVTLVQKLVGSYFLAGKIVSALAGLSLVSCTYWLVRISAAKSVATLAALAVLLNGAVFVHGMQACSDMLFAAFTMAMVLCAVQTVRRPNAVWLVLLGWTLGLAMGTRYTAFLFLPAVLAVAVWPRASQRSAAESPGSTLHLRAAARRLALTIAAAALGYLPHGVLNTLSAGAPFANEAWRSTALKYGGGTPHEVLLPKDPSLLWQQFEQHWAEWMRIGIADFGRVWTRDLPAMLFAQEAEPYLLGMALLGLLLLATLLERRAALVVPVAVAALYALGIALSFTPMPRLMFPALALLVAGLGGACASSSKLVRHSCIVSLCALVAAEGLRLPAQLRSFQSLHPLPEIEAARELGRNFGSGILIASSYGDTGMHVPCKVFWIPDVAFGAAPDGYDFWQHLFSVSSWSKAEFFVVGKISDEAMHRGLRTSAVGQGFEVLRSDDDVLVLRLANRREWIAAATAQLDQVGGFVELRIALALGADPSKIAAAGFALFSPTGEESQVQLRTIEEHGFVERIQIGQLGKPGRWRLVPVLVLLSNARLLGEPIEFGSP